MGGRRNILEFLINTAPPASNSSYQQNFMGENTKDNDLPPLFTEHLPRWHSPLGDDLTWGPTSSLEKILFFRCFAFFVCLFSHLFFYLLAGFNLFIWLPRCSFTRCCDKGIFSNKISLSGVNKTAVWRKTCGFSPQRGDKGSVQLPHLCTNPSPTPL